MRGAVPGSPLVVGLIERCEREIDLSDAAIPQPVAIAQPSTAHLKRALGRWDLVALFVVAVFNLNVVPSIAANGGVTVWLWIISLVLFFWPQGIAVIELAHRYPGEGGVYLWAKEVFGDFHGFLSGWCYWTNNMMYVPTVMLYFVGVSVFALPGRQALADNRYFAVIASLSLLAILVILNILGLGVGKWINNIGSIGTGIAAAVLIGLGVVVWLRFGTTVTSADFRIPADPRFMLNSFGVICFGLVGLELASVMGDEIKDPRKTLPGAVAWGGLLSGFLYIATTLTLLIAVSKDNINVLEGIVQAVSHMADRVGVAWIVAPFAFMLSISIAGIGSAWLAGSARIPFVAGLDSYLPSWMGKVHPRYGTPYAALLVHFVVSSLLVLLNFMGSGVQETFQRLLSLAVVLQLLPFLYMYAALLVHFVVSSLHVLLSFMGSGVQETFQRLLSLAVVLQLLPFLYMFAALLKIASNPAAGKGHYSRTTLILAGSSGLLMTILGMVFAFAPAKQITSVRSYEAWMVGGTAAFIGMAVFFFYVYGKHKTARAAASI